MIIDRYASHNSAWECRHYLEHSTATGPQSHPHLQKQHPGLEVKALSQGQAVTDGMLGFRPPSKGSLPITPLKGAQEVLKETSMEKRRAQCPAYSGDPGMDRPGDCGSSGFLPNGSSVPGGLESSDPSAPPHLPEICALGLCTLQAGSTHRVPSGRAESAARPAGQGSRRLGRKPAQAAPRPRHAWPAPPPTPGPRPRPEAASPAGEPPTCSGGAAAAAIGGGAGEMQARAASAPLAGWAAGRAAGSGAPGSGGAPPAGQAPPRAQRPQSPGAAAPSRAAGRLRVRRRRGGRERGPAQSPPPQAWAAGSPEALGGAQKGPQPTHHYPSRLTFLC